MRIFLTTLAIFIFSNVVLAEENECIKQFVQDKFESGQKTANNFINLLKNSKFVEAENYISPEVKPNKSSNGQFLQQFLSKTGLTPKGLGYGGFVGNDLLINHKHPDGLVKVNYLVENSASEKGKFVLILYVRTSDSTIFRMDIKGENT